MRPLDDAPNTDELLPDVLAGNRDRTGRAGVTDALDAIDGALTDNIRPLTGAAAMNYEPRMVITQYRAFGEQRTTVVCPKHERELLALLRKYGIGSGSTFAGSSLLSCDRCARADS